MTCVPSANPLDSQKEVQKIVLRGSVGRGGGGGYRKGVSWGENRKGVSWGGGNRNGRKGVSYGEMGSVEVRHG